MRTSRTSQETTEILQALSPRRTRGSANLNLQRFAYDNPREIKDEDVSSLSSVNTVDIEDILEPPTKRRKAAPAPAPAPARAQKTNEAPPPTKRTRRTPARKIKTDGATTVQPPSDWETIYNTVKKMRAMNPTAPVDTMGCAELYWRASSVKEQRFHILIALMLSSQTKDTVTAVAMGRLHTELGVDAIKTEDDVKKEEDIEDGIKTEDIKKEDGEEKQASTLTLKNILAVSPQRLNELIRTVGFHNNKTKYIKATAQILHDKFNSDIPSTAPELMSLPGVGPKMAYLCMSAAWGKHDGIGVDVHVHRITNLWGWHKTKNPEETRAALESWLPRDKWHEINKLLVGLGQTVCLPVGRRCGECDLAGTKLCKSEVRGK
ncbi:endonuclease III domain-containing protein [Aspergillus glaucus CBS 516.65]|uniref:Endonuclease III homolog n=1 Tax=Aspergillus glaucus CBS 516.65 TaxID=1160497 RepID=A0A1L9V4S8_ASPGL|nr:hypothetical protein ASPGLDRAFT_159812 [Aspergillus glaucus CBS 516.65]OJJ78927.1 hypothetical protein ASPGLDRAFT_159812 [Aspergillus glaucus CBS 516.65]